MELHLFVLRERKNIFLEQPRHLVRSWLSYPTNLKGIHHCPIEVIKGLTDKGQFQYLTKLKGPQVGNYLFTTQFLSLK